MPDILPALPNILPLRKLRTTIEESHMFPEQNNPIQALDFTSVEDQLLCIAAMFEGNFSIDWLVDLTGYKPTRLLSILEHEVGKNRLAMKTPGVYTFVETRERLRFLKQLP